MTRVMQCDECGAVETDLRFMFLGQLHTGCPRGGAFRLVAALPAPREGMPEPMTDERLAELREMLTGRDSIGAELCAEVSRLRALAGDGALRDGE